MKEEKLLIVKINSLLKQKNAKLIEFKYYKKVFGNMVVLIENGEQKHLFVADKGAIYHNDKLFCDNSYHIKGKDDCFNKLCEAIMTVLK